MSDAAHVARLIQLMREADLVLRTIEWRGSRTSGPRYCPQCDATASDGHTDVCPLQKVRDDLSRVLSPHVLVTTQRDSV